MAEKEKIHRTTIGGQALIEGIMMKGPKKTAMAVRKTDGTIALEETPGKERKWYNKAPFIRGSVNFVEQLSEGYRYLTRSAELSGMAEDDGEEELTKFEKWLNDKLGEKLMGVIMGIAMVLGVALALVLFFFVPSYMYTGIEWLVDFFAGEHIDISVWRTLFEGIVKIALFVAYMAVVAKMKEIRRTYEYHGAEHKTIACYEAGKKLTVENVRPMTRFHPRCGTSFIIITLLVSILVYMVVPITPELFKELLGTDSDLIAIVVRTVCKLLLLPLVVGIAYEIIRLAGRYDNILTKIISAPGLALQRLTTKEPDDKQIEVAIAAMEAVIPEDRESDKW